MGLLYLSNYGNVAPTDGVRFRVYVRRGIYIILYKALKTSGAVHFIFLHSTPLGVLNFRRGCLSPGVSIYIFLTAPARELFDYPSRSSAPARSFVGNVVVVGGKPHAHVTIGLGRKWKTTLFFTVYNIYKYTQVYIYIRFVRLVYYIVLHNIIYIISRCSCHICWRPYVYSYKCAFDVNNNNIIYIIIYCIKDER